MGEKTPSILIVDDEEMVLASLRGVFTLQTDYDVHQASTPKDAIRHVERARVDVVISDFLMPEMNGIEAVREFQARGCAARVVFLTVHAEPELVENALSTGAQGYVLKQRAARDRARDAAQRRAVAPRAREARSGPEEEQPVALALDLGRAEEEARGRARARCAAGRDRGAGASPRRAATPTGGGASRRRFSAPGRTLRALHDAVRDAARDRLHSVPDRLSGSGA